jgi:hypothetical protein
LIVSAISDILRIRPWSESRGRFSFQAAEIEWRRQGRHGKADIVAFGNAGVTVALSTGVEVTVSHVAGHFRSRPSEKRTHFARCAYFAVCPIAVIDGHGGAHEVQQDRDGTPALAADIAANGRPAYLSRVSSCCELSKGWR